MSEKVQELLVVLAFVVIMTVILTVAVLDHAPIELSTITVLIGSTLTVVTLIWRGSGTDGGIK
jgi:hypothetical protein